MTDEIIHNTIRFEELTRLERQGVVRVRRTREFRIDDWDFSDIDDQGIAVRRQTLQLLANDLTRQSRIEAHKRRIQATLEKDKANLGYTYTKSS